MNTNYKNQATPPALALQLKQIIYVLALFLSCCYMAWGQTTVPFTTTGAGTWTSPCDVTSITVEVWGAGGGGQRANGNPSAGGGGSGGGYVRTTYTVTPNTTYNLYVGVGGSGNSGVNGEASWFVNNTTVLAVGGRGAGTAITANSTFGAGAIAFTTGNIGGTLVSTYGGNGGTAISNESGGGGSSAGDTTGNNAAGITSGAAPTNGFAGANGNNTNLAGNNGNVGAGGSGGRTNNATDRNGGAGGRGEIRITYISSTPTYCTPTFTTGVEPITNVTFAGINKTTSNTLGGSASENFCDVASVQQSNSYAISLKGNTDGNFEDFFTVFIDWNQNGNFGDLANEKYEIGSIVNSTGIDAITLTGTIAVPISAALGNTRMRVIKLFNSFPAACNVAGYGQAEDYSVSVTAAPACTTPTAQPTALALTPALTSITGSFTAAVPAPNNYLVVISTSATAPTPTNGTTYTIGATLAAGYTVVDVDSNTTFTASGLTGSTLYNVYVFSYNSACSGGPLYLATSPLTNSTTTLAASYCTPTSEGPEWVFIDDVKFLGTLNDVSNLDSNFNATTGYQNFTALPKAIQAQGEGINVYYLNESFSGSAQVKAWVDWNKDGDFTDSGELIYDTGNIFTSSATFGFVIPAATTPGDYRIRIRSHVTSDFFEDTFNYVFNSCENFDHSFFFDDYKDGETEDYLFTVIPSCAANITVVTNGSNCGAGTVNLSVTATGGATSYKWYAAETGGSAIATTTTNSWTTPSLTATTSYWVTALNGTCESIKRTKITATIHATPVVSFTQSSPAICGDSAIMQITAGGDVETVDLINENFEAGGLGVFNNSLLSTSNGATIDAITTWQNETSPYIPADTEVWSPAISSGILGNKFVMSTSDVNPTNPVQQALQLTTAVNASNMTGLTLTFDLFYSKFSDEVRIQANTGSGWTTVQTISASVGIGTRFAAQTIDLSAYNNTPSLRVRIVFWSTWGDGVAVDNIRLFGQRPLNTAFNYNTTAVAAFTNAAATIPYTSGTAATTLFLKPTLAQLENATFTIPVTATLSNGCSATGSVTITNNTKMFVAGTTDTDWNTATNWKPNGVPTANNCVVVYDNVAITGTNYKAVGSSLTIKPTGNLNVASTNTCLITDVVTVESGGVFDVENDASLIQINNVANSGTINYKRIAPGIRGFDYVYWSSPVASQPIASIYTSPASGFKYQWNPTVANSNGGQGNWEGTTTNMQVGKGYIIRGSSSYGMPATNITGTFTGVPNNGNIPFTISRGTYTGVPFNGTNGIQITNINDNINLVGNPYPSAIDSDEFLAANTFHATTNPTGTINGNISLWTHGSVISNNVNPFYDSFTYNYNANDYVTLNFLGASSPSGASKIVKAGQAFIVQMVDGATGTGTINFTNSMRLDASNNAYDNSGFFRTSTNTNEKHRIWLDIVDTNNTASGTLVGYATEAANAYDTFYDAKTSVTNNLSIYSIIDEVDVYKIQGKALPFNQDDQVPLGIKTVTAGTYKIALNTIDGLFLDTTQNIFVEDLLTNVVHNLKTSPYSFTAEAGMYNNRFVLRYSSAALNIDDFDYKNNVIVYTNENININVSKETIQSVQLFDLLGKEIANYKDVKQSTFVTKNVMPTQSTLLVKVTLENGFTKTYKVIF